MKLCLEDGYKKLGYEKMDKIEKYKNELNKIGETVKKLRIVGGIFFLIWLPIFIYHLWIDWGHIQKYGIFEGSIKSLGEPIWIICWVIFLIILPILLSIKSNENKKKEIKEKLKSVKKCPECNKAISSDFNICPHCGKKFEEKHE